MTIQNGTNRNARSLSGIIAKFKSKQEQYNSGNAVVEGQREQNATVGDLDLRQSSDRGTDNAQGYSDEQGEVTPEESESGIRLRKVTDPAKIAELEASPKRTGYRNVVLNEDGSLGSPMADSLKGTSKGADRVKTETFKMNEWEEAEENPSLADENSKITLVKPSGNTVAKVDYNPYIHNRLDPVNLQFKDAWKRDDLVYVETEVAETDLNSGYHADKAVKPVGVHSWSNGALMLSRYDKPVRILPWDEVADAWAKRLGGKGVNFDRVPAAMRELLVERGVEILPPNKGYGRRCKRSVQGLEENTGSEGDCPFPQGDPRNGCGVHERCGERRHGEC